MYKRICIVLVLLLVASTWIGYKTYKENDLIKRTEVLDYSFNAYRIEEILNDIIDGNEKENIINLSRIIAIMDTNAYIASSSNPAGGIFTLELFTINREKAKAIYSAYEEAVVGDISPMTMKALIEYRDKISIITEELEPSSMNDKSIKQLGELLKVIAEDLK